MASVNRTKMRNPKPNGIWNLTLRKLAEIASFKKNATGLDLNDDDLKNLKWVYAYSETGCNSPPQVGGNETQCSQTDIIYDANELASIHCKIDPETVSEVALEIQ